MHPCSPFRFPLRTGQLPICFLAFTARRIVTAAAAGVSCCLQAVCHSSSSSGTGEVSTSNYEARKYGVRSGQFIRCAGCLSSDRVLAVAGQSWLSWQLSLLSAHLAPALLPSALCSALTLECSHAKELCPQLVVVPYMFEQYEAVSDQVQCMCLFGVLCMYLLWTACIVNCAFRASFICVGHMLTPGRL